MIHQRLGQRKSGVATDEAEALQTDVMRFLAIICMCLMIVFSLVQSLPVSSRENKPTMQDAGLLDQEITALKKRAQKLSQDIATLDQAKARHAKQVEAMIVALKQGEADLAILVEKKKIQAQQIARKTQTLSAVNNQLMKAQENIADFHAQISAANQQLEKQQADLDAVQRLISISRAQLAAAEQSAREARQALRKRFEQAAVKEAAARREEEKKAAVAAREAAEKKRIAALKQQAAQQAAAIRERQRERESQTAARETPATPTADPPPEKRGFSLSFASNSALDHLLSVPDGVSLYLLAGGSGWQLGRDKSGIYRFFKSRVPNQLYDMDIRTVPEKIQRAGRKVVAAFGKGQSAYGVRLTPSMQNSISQLMATHEWGDLIIAKNGDISIE